MKGTFMFVRDGWRDGRLARPFVFLKVAFSEADLQKLIFKICPLFPTNHPAFGFAKATAQYPLAPGIWNHV